jgi:hypothetical protein
MIVSQSLVKKHTEQHATKDAYTRDQKNCYGAQDHLSDLRWMRQPSNFDLAQPWLTARWRGTQGRRGRFEVTHKHVGIELVAQVGDANSSRGRRLNILYSAHCRSTSAAMMLSLSSLDSAQDLANAH